MKTKLVTLQIRVPDNGKPHSLCVTVIDSTPVSLNDSDRQRGITRQVWFVDAGTSEPKPVG